MGFTLLFPFVSRTWHSNELPRVPETGTDAGEGAGAKLRQDGLSASCWRCCLYLGQGHKKYDLLKPHTGIAPCQYGLPLGWTLLSSNFLLKKIKSQSTATPP